MEDSRQEKKEEVHKESETDEAVEGVVAQKKKESEPPKPRRKLVRMRDVASASASDSTGKARKKRVEVEAAPDTKKTQSSGPLEQLWKKSKQKHEVDAHSKEAALVEESRLADEAAARDVPSLAKELLLVSIKTNQRLNRLIRRSSMRFSRALLSYDPPGDGLCGFRVIYVLIQIAKVLGLLLAGNHQVCEHLSTLSTVQLKAFFLSKRTLDEKRRLERLPAWRQVWCSTADMERLTALTGLTFWYASKGYDSTQNLYRVQSFDDAGPARFAISVAAVCVNENHFQLADLSPILKAIAAEGQHIVMSTTMQQLENLEEKDLQKKKSSVLYYSYEDDSAQNVLRQTEDIKQWLQVFTPVMTQLGWVWVAGYDETDSVYELRNGDMLDNGARVTGTEALRQYFLSDGGSPSAPASKVAPRERRQRELLSL
jgi:hypothetical protein